MPRNPWLRALAPFPILLFLLLPALPASGQLLRGRVVHVDTREPIPDVAVLVLADTAIIRAIITDSLGDFEVELPRAGRYRLSASRAGYQPIGPESFRAQSGRLLDVVIRMAADVVVLDPISVRARAMTTTSLDRARERIDRNRRFGIGTHMTRAEIDASNRHTMTDLLAGHRAQQWRNCRPELYLDGVRVHEYAEDLDVLITPSEVEAVEMYSGVHARDGFHDRNGCGVLLVWSRRDIGDRYRFTWIGSGVIAGLLTLIYLGW